MAKKSAKSTKKKTTARSSGGSRKRFAVDPKKAEGKHLVIVESPTKAKTINKYLGPDYFVMASVGHVRDLPKSAPKGSKREDHPVPGVDLKRDFQPSYEVLPEKKQTISDLKKAAKVAADIWFATDLDREGEAIAWHLAEALKVPIDEAKRVVFNAITKSEVDRAFEQPRRIETNRVDAQQARRILDRIVGYQVSPLLWKKVAGGLSAGRVQSVATRLVVERERQIEAFVPDETWKITGVFTPDLDQAGDLAKSWHDFTHPEPNTEGESVPPTGRARNAWLTEHNSLQAELIEFDGKKFEPRIDTESILGPCDNPTPETIEAYLSQAAKEFDKPDDHNVAPEVAEIAAACGLQHAQVETSEQTDARGPARWPRTITGTLDASAGWAIESIDTKRTKSRPSPPFITSTMQQQASTRLGFNLQRTMRVAQQLYEGIDLKGPRGQTGLITYMRTDSVHLSGQALDMARGYIGGKLGDQYLPENPNFFKSSNKDAQEAHEAIRPTDASITPSSIQSRLTDEQFKLYDLIWRRFVACQMVPAEWDATSIVITGKSGNNATAKFRTSGRTLVFDGYLRIMGLPQGGDAILPPLEKNQPVAALDLEPTQHFSSPKARFTEASLQKELETEGIGRPSTYAAIIGTIQDRKYVETVTPRDKRLMATDLGKVVNDMLVEAFPTILDVGYTRELEAHLDEIESDDRDWKKTLHEFYDPFVLKLEHAMENVQHAKAKADPAPHICPKCGSATEYKFGRNGRFLSCTAFNVPPVKVKVDGHKGQWYLHKAKGKARPKVLNEDASDKVLWTKLTKDDKAKFQAMSDDMPEPCTYAAPIDRDGNPMEPELTDVLCPIDDQPMIRRTGRFGPFLASSNYPEVQFILKLDPKKGHVVLPKTPPMTTEIICPKCNTNPYYVRDGKNGLWLSCSGFPKCRGRGSFKNLEDDVAEKLEKAWKQHEKENPVPQVKTATGHVITDEEMYVPVVAGEREAVDAGDPDTIDAAA